MLRSRLEELISKRKPVDRFRIEASCEGLGERHFLVHARRIEAGEHRPQLILITLEDVIDEDRCKEAAHEPGA